MINVKGKHSARACPECFELKLIPLNDLSSISN